MSQMLLVYTTCKDSQQAKTIGQHLLDKKLAACVNILPNIQSCSLWPPRSGLIEEAQETILLIKTLEEKYHQIEKEIKKLHSYEMPCVFAMAAAHVSDEYYQWIKEEVE